MHEHPRRAFIAGAPAARAGAGRPRRRPATDPATEHPAAAPSQQDRSTPELTPLEVRILRVLDAERGAAPKDVADALGVPVFLVEYRMARLADGAARRPGAGDRASGGARDAGAATFPPIPDVCLGNATTAPDGFTPCGSDCLTLTVRGLWHLPP